MSRNLINPVDQRLRSYGARIIKKRFNLDQARDLTFTKSEHGNNFESSFVGFWIYAVSDDAIIAEIKEGIRTDVGDTLPIRPNMVRRSVDVVNGEVTPVDGARFVWPAQPGKFFDVAFFIEGTIDVRTLSQEITGSISVDNGAGYRTKFYDVTISASSTEILSINNNRKKSVIQNRGSDSIFIGSSSDLATANFYNENIEVAAGFDFEICSEGQFFARSRFAPQRVVVIEFLA